MLVKRHKFFYYSTLEQNIISRQSKLDFLAQSSLNNLAWEELHPAETKDYWFVKKDFTGKKIYKKFIKINDIFKEYVSGIESRRDKFCVKYTRSDIDNLKEELSKNEIHVVREKYQLKDDSMWSLAAAVDDIKMSYNPVIIQYRPFDYRHTSLSKLAHHFLGLPFYKVMQHFDDKENVGISFVRQFSDAKPYTNALISQYHIERRANYSFEGGAYIAPLYLYGENLDGEHPGEITRATNFTQDFTEKYLKTLNWKPAPEDILNYIYAVLNSKIYRTRYIEFLKTDFPAIPMTKNKTIFDTYAALGKKLVNLHLLKNLPADRSIKVSLGAVKGAFIIEKLEFANSKIQLSVTPANNAHKADFQSGILLLKVLLPPCSILKSAPVNQLIYGLKTA